jgi:hypothetical protein
MSTKYSGYQPKYEKEFVTMPPSVTSVNKYHDTAPSYPGLMYSNQFSSVYQRTSGPHSRAIVSNTREAPRTMGESRKIIHKTTDPRAARRQSTVDPYLANTVKGGHAQRFERTNVHRNGNVVHDDRWDMSKEEAFTHRPTYAWKSSYARTHDSFEARRSYTQTAKDTVVKSYLKPAQSGEDAFRGSFRFTDLRKEKMLSSYGKDFGEYGHDPKTRWRVNANGSPGQGPPSRTFVSDSATSIDLFRGTTKGSKRLPGYTGYLPQSKLNEKQVQSEHLYRNRDDMLLNYRFELPGYTGNRPTDASNAQRGRRDNRKKPSDYGKGSGFMIESMLDNPPKRTGKKKSSGGLRLMVSDY